MTEHRNIPADEIYQEQIYQEQIYQEQIYAAGYGLLSDLHDLTYHQGDGQGLRFEVESLGVAYVVENLRSVAERAQAIAAATIEALDLAEAAHTWMVSGRPTRCATCGYDIDPDLADEWRICRDLPEHTYCHRPDATEEEDRSRAWVIEDDELAAYCENRERAGGPFHGDEVDLRFPDRHTVQGSWYVPGPAPLAAPLVLVEERTAAGWIVTEVSPPGAQVSVTALGEDLSDYAVPSLDDLARGAELAAALAGRAEGDLNG